MLRNIHATPSPTDWWCPADTEPAMMTPSLKSYIVDYISPLNPIKLASPSSDTAKYSGSYISYIPQFHYLPIHSHDVPCFSRYFSIKTTILIQISHFAARVFERAPSDIFGHPGRVQPGGDSCHGNLQGLHHLAGKRKPWVPRAEVAEGLEGS